MLKMKMIKNKDFQINELRSVVRWVVKAEVFLGIIGCIYFGFKGWMYLLSYVVGCMLVLLNFLFLARILPPLIRSREVKASITLLLFNFYARLVFTGLVLLIVIVFLDFPIFPLLLGLSTIVLGIISCIVKFIYTNNHKEACGYVRSSTTRIAS